ncbi:MAG: hypothetical protein JNJ83_11100 [Verrucomicrobiaceae bacterium]|nr:hypothetical protein [Verrucomicrobiaceae bacterium]
MIWELAVGGTLLALLGALAGWLCRHGIAQRDACIARQAQESEFHRGYLRGAEETRTRMGSAGRRLRYAEVRQQLKEEGRL